MSRWIMTVNACSHMGNIRSNNEDNLYLNGTWMEKNRVDEGISSTVVCCDEKQLYAVCDGMGGIEYGECASYAAVSRLAALKQVALKDSEQMQNVVSELNEQVFAVAQSLDAGGACGTTFTALAIEKNDFVTLNVGDSRVCLYRHGRLHHLTKDHTEVQRMIDLGFLKPADVRTHPKRHVISRYLGMKPEMGRVQADITPRKKIHSKDCFVLCSDGLYDMLTDDEIVAVLRNERSAEALRNAALAAGGHDNITVVIVCAEKKKWFSK